MKRSQFDPAEVDPRSQVAALCWRMHRDQVEVLLITSRDTGRWVLPKGWPMDGYDAPGSAAQEAWEEAGVTGTVNPAIIGLFGYDKVLAPEISLPCMVSVFGLRVAGLARRFPERGERRRKWFSADVAARKVAEPELRFLLRGIANGLVTLDPGSAA
jgi:8-oxo-dGTP pyrophosphatase MutT (NUDIX family)